MGVPETGLRVNVKGRSRWGVLGTAPGSRISEGRQAWSGQRYPHPKIRPNMGAGFERQLSMLLAVVCVAQLVSEVP